MAKDFPNKWRKIKDIPADKFEPLFYEDVMDWKIAGWELPADVACVIRARNLEDSKIKEHVYKRMSAAESKIRQYMTYKSHELVICAEEALYYVHPEQLENTQMMMTDLQYARFIIELDRHPHKEEVIELWHQQIDDENSVKYSEEDANRI